MASEDHDDDDDDEDTKAPHPFLEHFEWGARGSDLAFVYRNNIYYKPSATSQKVQCQHSFPAVATYAKLVLILI